MVVQVKIVKWIIIAMLLNASWVMGAVGPGGAVSIIQNYPELRRAAPGGGGGTPTLVQVNHQEGGTLNAIAESFGSNNTAGNMLWLAVTGYDTPGPCTVDTIADTALNTWTVIHSSGNTDNLNNMLATAYAKNVAGGANTVTVTLDAGCQSAVTLTIQEWSGLDTAAPLTFSNADSGTSSNAGSGAMTAPAGTKLILGAVTDAAGGAQTISTLNDHALHARSTDGDTYWHFAASSFGGYSSNTITAGVVYASSFTLGGTNAWTGQGAMFK